MVPKERDVTAPDDSPNWRDSPTALDQLCDDGALDLYGPFPEYRDVATITPRPEYL